jgi:hypothetical protein
VGDKTGIKAMMARADEVREIRRKRKLAEEEHKKPNSAENIKI